MTEHYYSDDRTSHPGRSMSRPGWDEWALGIATAVATRADCTRSRVGAVILDRDGHIVATGYNGTPGRREDGCLTAGACTRGTRTYAEQPAGGSYADCTARHAEANAIGQALMHGQAARLYKATIAVTRTPCDQCAGLIRRWDIARVVTPEETA